MSDTVYYSDSSIQITDKEIKLPHRKYRLRDVKSVSIDSMSIEPTVMRSGWFFYLYALFYFGLRIIEEPDALRFSVNLREGTPIIDIGLVYVFFSIVIAARAYVLHKSFSDKAKSIHIATISGSFSKAIVATSLRKDYVEKVAYAIKRAASGVSPSTTPASEELNNSHDIIRYQYEVEGRNRQGIWLDGKVYDAQDIRIPEKVSAWTYPQAALAGLIADVSLLCILITLVWSRLIPEGGFPGVAIALVPLFGVELFIGSAMWVQGWREVYLVKLFTSSGIDYAFASIDAQRVQRVVDVISPLSPYGSGSGYISDSVVEVNDTMARFGRKKFPIEDIQAVDIQTLRVRKQKQATAGIAVLTLGTVLMIMDAFSTPQQWDYWLLSLGSLLVLPGVMLLIASSQVTYTLILQGSFGKVQAYSSHSELYVRKIATILRGVLMRRGEIMEAQET